MIGRLLTAFLGFAACGVYERGTAIQAVAIIAATVLVAYVYERV